MQRASLFSRFVSPQRRCYATNKLAGPKSPAQDQPKRNVAKVAMEPFMTGTSSVYIEEMYRAWLQNPSDVHKSWDSYFRAVQSGAAVGEAYTPPPTLAPGRSLSAAHAQMPIAALAADERTIIDHLSVQLIIRSFQTRGHNIADLDPLGIEGYGVDLDNTMPPELELATYGLSEKDLDRDFILPKSTHIGGDKNVLPLREIINRLKNIYCRHIGVEYMHINNFEQMNWLRQHFEAPKAMDLSSEQKKVLFKRLIRSTKFEDFLAKKWPSEKRFGLEGCEVLIPAVKEIIDVASANGVDNFVIGMPHRGRLNVLANVCRQPLEALLSQFNLLEPADEGSGDVKYHLGVCIKRRNRQSQKDVQIAVVANPSHLEAVDPVVQGKTKAEQFYGNDNEGQKTMSILMHGDAAFAGQGVVYETLHLSELPMFTTNGTIHIVVNNQIGFTTDPRSSRSSPYCTDVARVVNCPIFHVNADDPEAVMHVCRVASLWRQKFKKDVVLDLVCYRRHGHNELDEPMFTQPLMYQTIKKQKHVLDQYKERIINEAVANDSYVKEELTKYGTILEDAYVKAQQETYTRNRDWLDSPWDDMIRMGGFATLVPHYGTHKETNFFKIRDPLKIPDTGISNELIKAITDKFSSVPEGFNLHRGLQRTLQGRSDMINNNTTDWALGEALAFGSLLTEGIHVRLSGQDVERGTFSHRHHVLHDQKVDKLTYNPLNHISDKQSTYTVCNSSLSEYAVLGFELGFSMTNPQSLCIWEAQFGDFANTAQCIIDQFICSGQSKWIRQSGLVMLLPHGYEGMGPEHSSARPERFLQLCNDDEERIIPDGPTFEAQQIYDANWIIANCTTPANIFHILRRQVAMPFRKPLVIMTPKSLLRHPDARSPLEDFGEDSRFQRLIPDSGPAHQHPDSVQRLIFVTGKLYYELAKARKQMHLDDKIAIARVEQISPFPSDLVKQEVATYPNAEIIWAQEEHKNMGSWSYVQPRFNNLFQDETTVKYAGRAPSSSTATGSKFSHLAEQNKLYSDALNVPIKDIKEALAH